MEHFTLYTHDTHPLEHFIHMFLLIIRGQVDQVGKADVSAGSEELVSDLACCIWPIVEMCDFYVAIKRGDGGRRG